MIPATPEEKAAAPQAQLEAMYDMEVNEQGTAEFNNAMARMVDATWVKEHGRHNEAAYRELYGGSTDDSRF